MDRKSLDAKQMFESYCACYVAGGSPPVPEGAQASVAGCSNVSSDISTTQSTLNVLRGISNPSQGIIDAILYGDGVLFGLQSCYGDVCS